MPPIKLTDDERLFRNFWGNVEKKTCPVRYYNA